MEYEYAYEHDDGGWRGGEVRMEDGVYDDLEEHGCECECECVCVCV